MRRVGTLLLLCAIAALCAAAFLFSGVYNIAADDPHTPVVYGALEILRDRSIAVRSAHINVPPLDDSALLLSGGADYNDMCAECHLKPGLKSSEMSEALYPQPPNLAKSTGAKPAEMFWVIKHGIKMSAMPAWGATHDDQRIWAMVAFLQRLPELSPDQYQILTARNNGGGDRRSEPQHEAQVHEH